MSRSTSPRGSSSTDVELPEIMAADETSSDETPLSRARAGGVTRKRGARFSDRLDGTGEVEWPAFASPRRDRDAEEEREGASDRVRYLFPVPDSTDWDVGELRYERKRSSSLGAPEAASASRCSSVANR